CGRFCTGIYCYASLDSW
nr:immunoglobulin heavy chain junction region [Macaca mulatta]